MKTAMPLLVVSDLPRSKMFYREVLHQTVVADFGANIDTVETAREFGIDADCA